MTTPDPLDSVDALDPLRARARSPDATQEDIDALLAECARPLGSDEDRHARAQALQSLLEDDFLGGFRGGAHRRRVDETAARALSALGEPYARELSPEARRLLERRPLAPPPLAPAPEAPRAWRHAVALVGLVWAGIELLVVGGTSLHMLVRSGDLLGIFLPLLAVAFSGASLIWPARRVRAPESALPGLAGTLTAMSLAFGAALLLLFYAALFWIAVDSQSIESPPTLVDILPMVVPLITAALVRLALMAALVSDHRARHASP